MVFPVTIEPLTNSLSVLRDDLIAGGTKRRALDVIIPTLNGDEIAYAGTIFGHGALALAHACEAAGKRARLYLSCNDDTHPMLVQIRKTNAVIEQCEPLPVAQLLRDAQGDYIFPLGFETPEFHEAMTETLRAMNIQAAEIWCAAVSGTMVKSLKAAYPQIERRIVSVVKMADAEFYAPEKYHQVAKSPPPYPSCPYTDAKVWQFARVRACAGALIWNIAG